MKSLDLQNRPVLPNLSSNLDRDFTPPRIEIDAFLMRAGDYASNCVPSNCPMFTADYGERPSLESEQALNK